MTESHGDHDVAATVSVDSERDPQPGSTTPPDSVEAAGDGAPRDASQGPDTTDDVAVVDDPPDISDLLGPETDDPDSTQPSTADGADTVVLAMPDPESSNPNPASDGETTTDGPAPDSGATGDDAAEEPTAREPETPAGEPATGAAEASAEANTESSGDVDPDVEAAPSAEADGKTADIEAAPSAEADGRADGKTTEVEADDVTLRVSKIQPPPPRPENAILLDPPIATDATPAPAATDEPSADESPNDTAAGDTVRVELDLDPPSTADDAGDQAGDEAAESTLAEVLARVTGEVPASRPPGIDDIEELLEQPTPGIGVEQPSAETDELPTEEPTAVMPAVTEPRTTGELTDAVPLVIEGPITSEPATDGATEVDPQTPPTPDEAAAAADTVAADAADAAPIEPPVTPPAEDAPTTVIAPAPDDAPTTVIEVPPTAQTTPPTDAADQPSLAVVTATPQPTVTILPTTEAKPNRALFATTLVVGGLAVLFLGAWAIDTARTSGQVMRGTILDSTPIGGLDEAGLAEVLDQRTSDLGEAAVVLQVGDAALSSDPLSLGAELDSEAITDAALSARRGGPFPLRPIQWLGTFFSDEVIQPTYVVDPATMAETAAELTATSLAPPQEPQLEVRGGEFVVTDGTDGVRFDPDEVAAALPGLLTNPAPYELSVTPLTAPPLYTNDEIAEIGDAAAEATGDDVVIRVLDQTADLDRPTLRSWVELAIVDEEPTWRINTTRALDDLKPLFPTLGSEDQQARFSVVDNTPIIIPASETVICCTEASIERIRDQLLEEPPPPPVDETDEEAEEGEGANASDDDDEEAEAPKRIVTIQPTVVGSDEGVAELEALGIVEEVSTFTTNHACCQNRVTNIQRFADLMRGVIIRPGEDFSLNEHVGRRTIANGFVADGAIINGILEPQVGGGISQFATTFFNASFYAGLEFNTYQSHSLYISRYPRGREATISWRRPDLSVNNNTEYGILVWPTYTPTSITVTFYSTKHIEVEDLPVLRSSRGQCSVYTTPRVRTYPDGTEVEDSVFALYRPGEGLDCNGNSTVPEEEPAGPSITPEPAPQPTPQPAPVPTPVPTTAPAPVVTTVPEEQLPSSTIPG